MPTDLDRLLTEPDRSPLPDIETLWRLGRRRRTGMFLLRGVAVVVLIIGPAVALGITFLGHPKSAPAHVLSPPVTPPVAPTVPTVPATTAYVVDAEGLVPIDLATGQVGVAITLAHFPDFSADYTGTPAPVVSPDGRTAYVVALPRPAQAGIDERGPALVPVNLVTGRVETPIPFRATAVGEGAQAPTFAISSMAMTPDGTTVLVADEADNVLIPIDVRTDRSGRPIDLPSEPAVNSYIVGQEDSHLPVQPSPIGTVVVTPDGRTAYVTDGYAVVPVDLVDRRAERPITGFDDASGIAIAPDGKTAYVTNPYCWESIPTGLCVKRPPHPVIEPNGRIQLYAGGDHVTVVDLRSNRIQGEIDVGRGAQPTGIAVAPDGGDIYVTYGQYGGRGGRVSVIDTQNQKIQAQINEGFDSDGEQGTNAIAVSPDGAEAFVSGFEVGPGGPAVFRGVVPLNLASDRADPAIDLGTPADDGVSTGGVVFGRS